VGHLKVLTSKAVNVAVLETHHRGILYGGFGFDRCDIAICLNVTEDHLGYGHIDTVEQMAEVKRALAERASQAVVLNADDAHCLDMLDYMSARQKCLVSMVSSRDQLLARHGDILSCSCVLEAHKDGDLIVIHDEQTRLPVMAVDAIPASCGGTARFMVSNAMHAALASYLSGVNIEVIRQALGGFKADYATTPGRLNVFDELPFRVVLDFAHNPDGMRNICEFVDRQEIPGRKVVAFAGSVDRADETLRHMGHSIAGHFDFYFCKEHLRADGTQPRLVARILQQGLMDKGVAECQTAITTHGRDAIFEIFDFCQPGDLLTMLLGHVEKHHLPGYISEYADTLKRDKPARN
ncbi:MAG: Mur ligase family protein, partial [Lysobacterales bacterium]